MAPIPEKGSRYNVIDYFKYWQVDAIRAALDKNRHEFAILCSNLFIDYNISSVIRNSNAFLASKVYIYGRRRYDRRGTVGTHNYEHIEYIPTIDKLMLVLKEYYPVGLDNINGALPIEEYNWEKKSLICLGQEDVGLPDEVIKHCRDLVYIKQFGSVRSLNVASASSIAMYSWCQQHGKY